MAAIRKLLIVVPLAVGLAWTLEPGRPYWLRACDKLDVEGKTLLPGTREWEDAPIRSDLLDALRSSGWTIRTTLRWTNRISAVASTSDALLPPCLDLVSSVGVARVAPTPPEVVAGRALSVDPAPVTLRRMHDTLGITAMKAVLAAAFQKPGQGVRVAVIDGGFVLAHRVLQGRSIVDAWDFVDSDSIPWDEGPPPWSWFHGTGTAGLIASGWDATLPGIAPDADLLLYRTEIDQTETVIEEDYLAAAIERAVAHEAKVISISLGYRYWFDGGNPPDHPFSSMDGKTLIASVTAAKAAARDVVVVAAMGNEGDDFGAESLNSPADADSILSVGSIAESGLLCGNSSQGPAADGRIKPELVAFGCTIPVASTSDSDGYYEGGLGTSYAAPLVAGMAVLLRQYQPGWSAMQVRDSLMATGSQKDAPDNLKGWGMPDLRRLLHGVPTGPRNTRQILPGVWQASRGALRFRAGTEPARAYEVAIRSLGGRLLYRGRRAAGEAILWTGTPPPGTYLASWSVEGVTYSSLVVVTDR